MYRDSLPTNWPEQWAVINSVRFRRPVFLLFQTELKIVYEEKNQSLVSKEETLDDAVNRILFKKHPHGQQATIGEVEHLKNPSPKNLCCYYVFCLIENFFWCG